ncbi:putative 2-aminoethylphosphonate ABC transporter ATP-binding protein [Oceanimonas smirnovii]|uniref:putative 2-aminoethylphosphonate ABC transporter ATP-binding protein n=1 Tax=Oceanimonas smirnovii TaxID=264574 RepID=UPI003FD413AE
MTYLTIDNVVKNFGDFHALKGVSLTVEEGEFICFLGPSGCGKTTLLRAIAGLDLPSEGRIEQAGRDITQAPPEQRDFGIVFQSYALFPNLTVYQNIAFGLENLRLPRAEIQHRVQSLLETIGLPDSGNKYPGQLSGGQQQRVALARAIALSPGLLLLDEPLSALDARVRVQLRAEIKRLQRELKVTTIMVTHDQEEALAMADRIVVMNHGDIEQIGTPEEIYYQPATPFVARFIGAMNFHATVADCDGRLNLGEHTLPRQVAPGSRHLLAWRPELTRLADTGEGPALRGRIQQLSFLGAFIRAEVAVDSHPEPILADLSARDCDLRRLQPGQEIALALPLEHTHLFSEACA